MFYIILVLLILLVGVILNANQQVKAKAKHFRTCKGCGYVYPSDYDFDNSNWVTSKHNKPDTDKRCPWFFHGHYQHND